MSICPVIRLLFIILFDISTKPILDLSAALTEKKKGEESFEPPKFRALFATLIETET